MALLNTNISYITVAQYQQLQSLMPKDDFNNQDRVAFYIKLADFTKSQAALDMAEIASRSGIKGGIAWQLNDLYLGKVPGYPADGVERFSQIIANSTFYDLIKIDPLNPNRYVVPSDAARVGRNN